MSTVDYADKRRDPSFNRRLAPLISDPHWATRERARHLLAKD
jgi:hypothetical protein